MKPTLVILAAGMASRYGSMKQTESFGPSGETIMEYSIFDAIQAGFGKVVFIIRKAFHADFSHAIGARLQGRVEVSYVFQELDSHLDGFTVPEGRTKPWGTAHAVLCARDTVREPFAVINADDFYGRDAFVRAYDFLTRTCDHNTYSIIGYDLLKTLSENGTVNRGVCEVDTAGNLSSISERLNISLTGGQVVCEDGVEPGVISRESLVSMNFWCFHPSYFGYAEGLFREFLSARIAEPKSEFFIPIVADRFIKDGSGVIRVIPTSSSWFGVTYKEDAPEVRKNVVGLVSSGEYPESLWA